MRDKRLKSFELCKSDSLPALFLQDPKPAKFRVLIAAGFHGNKPAGPVGLNKWAKNLPIDDDSRKGCWIPYKFRPWVCVTETPIKIKEKQRSLAKRAEGTQDLITTFINWVINKK